MHALMRVAWIMWFISNLSRSEEKKSDMLSFKCLRILYNFEIEISERRIWASMSRMWTAQESIHEYYSSNWQLCTMEMGWIMQLILAISGIHGESSFRVVCQSGCGFHRSIESYVLSAVYPIQNMWILSAFRFLVFRKPYIMCCFFTSLSDCQTSNITTSTTGTYILQLHPHLHVLEPFRIVVAISTIIFAFLISEQNAVHVHDARV